MDEWRTYELALATFLCLKEHSLKRIEWEAEGDTFSCFFYFDDTDSLHDDVEDYLGGEALVDPSKFTRQFANLKRRMFACRPVASAS